MCVLFYYYAHAAKRWSVNGYCSWFVTVPSHEPQVGTWSDALDEGCWVVYRFNIHKAKLGSDLVAYCGLRFVQTSMQ